MFENIGNDVIPGGIFERFPQLKPYVHEDYANSNKHNKLLVICESNYFDLEDSDISNFRDSHKWYLGTEKNKLIPCCLIHKVANDGKITYLRGLYSIVKTLLNTDKYSDVAFYNYFLRPALNGSSKGFKNIYEDIDGEVAFAAFLGIIKTIKPDIVVFASAYAWEKMQYYKKKNKKDFSGIIIEKISHPSSQAWNKNNGIYGKYKFEQILKEKWLIKQI